MKKYLIVIFLVFSCVTLSQEKNISTAKVVGYNIVSISSSMGSFILSDWMINKKRYGSIDPYTVPIFSSFVFYGALESIMYMSLPSYRPSIINLSIGILTSTITMAIKNRINNSKNEIKL